MVENRETRKIDLIIYILLKLLFQFIVENHFTSHGALIEKRLTDGLRMKGKPIPAVVHYSTFAMNYGRINLINTTKYEFIIHRLQ